MNDYVYLFTVFIAMGAVTAAERLLPFACSSWLRKQRWVGVVGDFLPLAIMVLLKVLLVLMQGKLADTFGVLEHHISCRLHRYDLL